MLLACCCAAALTPTGVALAQNGVSPGSAKNLSSAPPSTGARSTSTTTTTSTSTSSATSSTAASTTSHVKQLPFTGDDLPVPALIGGAMLAAGLALRVRLRHARGR